MADFAYISPDPENEPILEYRPGSPERAQLAVEIAAMSTTKTEVPMTIGGKRIRTGRLEPMIMPHRHSHVLGRYHRGDAQHVHAAIEAAEQAWRDWSQTSWEERAAIFLKAADLLAGKYRAILNAATMLGQSKVIYQAEIDSACELIDFFRFNVRFLEQIVREQPRSAEGVWNRFEQRPLEGFILAVTPFNFTSIAANLPTAPALMGNTVIWKPSESAMYSAHFILKLLEEAGLPPGVINLVAGDPATLVERAVDDPDFAGIHFTGSTQIFRGIWQKIAQNIGSYRNYPRIVGETGGKDFVVAHRSADVEALSTALVRGAFEYQGQKCSAASRAYVPKNLWPQLRARLITQASEIVVGDVCAYETFMGAVINRRAFESITGFIEHAKKSDDARIVSGGNSSDEIGFFIDPTIISVDNPRHQLMTKEVFGPVLTIFIYPESEFDAALELCNETSPYGLTGAIFATERTAIRRATTALRHAAGNFYINDKPTGAVVWQQPFGGSRASGTNDKAGSPLNLQRWVTPRVIKETFCPPTDFRYPSMSPDTKG